MKILSIPNFESRTFGWVQDPSKFENLCDVVAVFNTKSQKHKDLWEKSLIVSLDTSRNIWIRE